MSPLDLTHSALQEAAGRIASCAREINAERTSLDSEVSRLMSGGWTGKAATDFAAGMRAWDAGAADIIAALDAMGGLVRAADARFAATDAVAGTEMTAAGSGLRH